MLSVEISYGFGVLGGGILVGVVVGFFTNFWIRRVNHNAILTINLTIVSAYMTYILADYINLGFR